MTGMLTSAGRRLLMLVAVAMCAILLAGCDSDAAKVRIENDTPELAELRLCDLGGCEKFYPPRYTLDPGESVRVNVSKTGVPSVYLVLDSDGRSTGCLPIVVHDPPETVVVPVSTQVSCTDEVPEEWP